MSNVNVLAVVAAALVLGLVNAIVRPVLLVLTLPLTLVTLGLFLFVLNAFCLWLTSAIVPGFVNAHTHLEYAVYAGFGDGLSFDQRRVDNHNVASANFLYFSRDFEPYDRLLFREGKVDHGEVASFEFMITDFTPRWEFFLVQDPRIPSS